MLGQLVSYTQNLYMSIPKLVGSMSQLTLSRCCELGGDQPVTGFILVLARVTPLFVLAPLFSSKMIPARVRGIIAVGAGDRPRAGRHARPARPH